MKGERTRKIFRGSAGDIRELTGAGPTHQKTLDLPQSCEGTQRIFSIRIGFFWLVFHMLCRFSRHFLTPLRSFAPFAALR
jgi:hypothetical protein